MAIDRRKFIRASGLSVLPVLLSQVSFAGESKPPTGPVIRFFGDGEMFEPADYLDILQKVNSVSAITRDRYGTGGAVEALEKKFAAITGKEKAIYMPSGTMANQLAISVLSGANSKVFVQDTSHVYRDEADAAQSTFGKRLMPLAKGATYFTTEQLKSAIESLPSEEVFQSGVGAVSIENPVRRTDGRMMPLQEIEKISTYCRAKGIGLHLDGARLYMASVWSGIPIHKWSSYFDTVYISLYKYLGASAGAILCGDEKLINKMPHLVKVHGGSMYGNWTNAAMALHRLEGFEERLKESLKRATTIFAALNKLPGITINAVEGGTNIYEFRLAQSVDGARLQERLSKEFNIRIPKPQPGQAALISVNESLLHREVSYVLDAFKTSLV